MNCDVCGEEMTAMGSHEDGKIVNYEKITTVIGVCINCSGNHPEVDRVKFVFGKTKFHICFVCYLKSLGVNPINE
jgi:hypothetical protein